MPPKMRTHSRWRTSWRALQRLNGCSAPGFNEAALLRAWAAAEASVRLLAEGEGLLIGRPTPSQLLKRAVMNGVLSREDYRFLLQALERCNAYVHGFTLPDSGITEVEALIDTARRLGSEASTPVAMS